MFRSIMLKNCVAVRVPDHARAVINWRGAPQQSNPATARHKATFERIGPVCTNGALDIAANIAIRFESW